MDRRVEVTEVKEPAQLEMEKPSISDGKRNETFQKSAMGSEGSINQSALGKVSQSQTTRVTNREDVDKTDCFRLADLHRTVSKLTIWFQSFVPSGCHGIVILLL